MTTNLTIKTGSAFRPAIDAIRSEVPTEGAETRRVNRRLLKTIGLSAVALAMLAPELAMASNPWDGAGTQILAIFTGGLTRTIAIIAIIACGVAALAGKLSWDWAIKIAVGILFIFGGTAIIDYLIAATS